MAEALRHTEAGADGGNELAGDRRGTGEKPLYDVVILGGRVQRASGGCVGAAAVAQVQGMLFDQGVYRRLRDGARVGPDRL